ncbi:MAG: formylglycine-generating enzyme family protein [Candidatus Cloacimonetes bacterium]|nr:formylglycine-generating enzyme family protein [Candidatus Cloacimonadota bacterium]
MDTLKATLLSILMLTLVLNLFSVTNLSGMAGQSEANLGDLTGFSTKEIAGRQVEDLVISVDGAGLTLTWPAVPGAVSYKVYSAVSPDLAFSEDFSGSFAGSSWTTPVNDPRRFYYVTSVGSGSPAGFVYVPGGTFNMGDTHGGGLGEELPVHSVTLSPYYIGITEVTQAEWQTVMGSNPASSYGVGDNYPVYNVSWYAIMKYCNLRSMAEELTPCYSISGSTDPANWGDVPTSNNLTWNAAICDWDANGYRLPTEAEWEYAARGAATNPDYLYSGSDDIDAVAWNAPTDDSQPVGTKAPNGIGTYDMSGNVFEWCWDRFGYYSADPQTDPTGPASGGWRIFRGGFWNSDDYGCRVSYRGGWSPYGSDYAVGFRVCRTVM